MFTGKGEKGQAGGGYWSGVTYILILSGDPFEQFKQLLRKKYLSVFLPGQSAALSNLFSPPVNNSKSPRQGWFRYICVDPYKASLLGGFLWHLTPVKTPKTEMVMG